MVKTLSKLLTFLGGLYFFLEFLLPEEIKISGNNYKFGAYHQELSIGLALISSFAVGLGVINIILVHGQKVLRSKKNVLPSAVLLISFIFTLIIQIASWINDEKIQQSWQRLQSLSEYIAKNNETPEQEKFDKVKQNILILQGDELAPLGSNLDEYRAFLHTLNTEVLNNSDKDKITISLKDIRSKISDFKKKALILAREDSKNSIIGKLDYLIFYGLFLPLGSSMFSILGFYITYAAFRSFRVRSPESTIMMLAALAVILGQIPQGVMYISPEIPSLRLWIMKFVSTPAFRAIYFCSALAGLSLAVRMWFSMDKNPFQKGS